MRRVLFFLIIGVLGVGILVSLGTWQIKRLQWKNAILAEIDERIHAAPVPLPETIDPARDKYLSVTLSGKFVGPDLRVLVSIQHKGAGYRVITGFDTGTQTLLIDRGFVKVDAPFDTLDGKEATLSGHLHWPDEKDGYTPDPDRAKNIWFVRDVPLMAQELGMSEALVVLSEANPIDTTVEAMPIETSGIPNDHLNYAITWFSLAAVWLLMTLIFLRQSMRHKKEA